MAVVCSSFVVKCHELESKPFITDKKSVKHIFTNTGYAVTKNCINIIQMCSVPINHTVYEPLQIDHDSYITIGRINRNTKCNKNIVVTHPYHLLCWQSISKTKKSFNTNIVIVTGSKGLDLDCCLRDDKDYCFIMTPSTLKKVWIQYSLMRTINFARVISYNIDVNKCLNKYKINYDFKWNVWSHISSLNQHIKLAYLGLLSSITVFSDDELTKDKKIEYNEIMCKKPIESITLDGLVERTIIDSIDTYDIKRVIKHLSSPMIKTEKDILKHVLKRFNDEIRVMEENELCVNKMEYASTQDKDDRMKTISDKKADIESKKNELVKRITENNLCFICYSTIEVKCVMKCCANPICFECINKWMNIKKSCPLCKYDNTSFFINEDFVEEKYSNSESSLSLNPNHCLFKNFTILIDKLLEKDNKRIVVVGKDESILNRFIKCMPSNVTPLKFKGNSFILHKLINRFQDQTTQRSVLLINHSKLECGFPIHNATDIVSTSSHLNIESIVHQCEHLKHVWNLTFGT